MSQCWLGNANRRQSIIWTNADPVHWRMERQRDIYSGFSDISNYWDISEIELEISKLECLISLIKFLISLLHFLMSAFCENWPKTDKITQKIFVVL